MPKKKNPAIPVKQFTDYLSQYSAETLESFIVSNDYIIDLWRKQIADLEQESATIRAEIEHRRLDIPPVTSEGEVDLSLISSVKSSTHSEDFYLRDASGEYSIFIPGDHPCNDLVRSLIDEWVIDDSLWEPQERIFILNKPDAKS